MESSKKVENLKNWRRNLTAHVRRVGQASRYVSVSKRVQKHRCRPSHLARTTWDQLKEP